jgi:hypothetical protein
MSTLSPSICVSPKDTVLVAGAFGGTVDFDPGPGVYELTSVGSRTDAYVAAFDTGGKFIWARRFGGDDDDKGDEFVGVASDADENVLLAGHIDGVADLDPGPGYNEVTAAGFRDILLVKLDSNGNLRETE